MFSDGKETVDYFENILNNIEETEDPAQPVSLLILDINMPIVNGIDAMKSIMDKYKKIN